MKISSFDVNMRSLAYRVKVAVIRKWARRTATLPSDSKLRDYTAYNLRIGIYRNYPVNEQVDVTERRAVHFAAMHGDYQLLLMLIWLGADLNLRDRPGLTPLEYAVRYQHYRCVRLIARVLSKRQRLQFAQGSMRD